LDTLRWSDVAAATNNFNASNRIGWGAGSVVYGGKLRLKQPKTKKGGMEKTQDGVPEGTDENAEAVDVAVKFFKQVSNMQ
jgi:hypothetical protein